MTSSTKQGLWKALGIGVGALRQYPWLAAVFLAATLSQGALQALLVWGLREVLRLFDQQQGGSLQTLALGAGAVLAVWMLRAGATFGGEQVAARLAHRVEHAWLLRLMRKLLQLSVRFFDKSEQGDLVLASYHDVKAIRLITLEVGQITLHVTRLLGLAVVAWMMSPRLATVGLVLVPLGLLPAQWFARRITRAADQQRAAIAGMSQSFLQLSAGIRVIKVNRSEDMVLDRAQNNLHRLYTVSLRQALAKSMSRFLFETVTGAGLVIVLVLGGREVAGGALEWQSLLSLLIAILAIYSPLMSLVSIQHTISSILPNIDRLERILDAPVEVPDRPNARPLREAPAVIRLEDLSFTYENEPVLQHLDITFHQGERVGIVGPSGAGKSTLLALLLRLYDPTSGRITLDGVDLRDLRHSDLLSLCAIVPQEPFIFEDTVTNNLRAPKPDATMAEIEAAARAANIHDDILAMDDGYDTLLGRSEHGRGVSTGQKQRLAIASALLKNAPILFLDEATSSLDSVSERAVQGAIERLVEGRTTFVIAHRLSTLRTVDRILVMERGRVVGFDTHDELLRTCPMYQRLWTAQSATAMTDEDVDATADAERAGHRGPDQESPASDASQATQRFRLGKVG